MSLHDRLTEDLKLAMKARDQLRMDVIRMIKAAVMNKPAGRGNRKGDSARLWYWLQVTVLLRS